MKLTRRKLIETIRRKNEGYTTYQARKIAGISIRRVNHVWKEYKESGKIPEIGKILDDAMDLIDAIMENNLDMVQSILNQGVDIHRCDDSDSITPLHHGV